MIAHSLPDPFFVIATQNPVSQSGTFALPESQLDRFLMRLSLGYPSEAAEKSLLQGDARRVRLDAIRTVLGREQLCALQALVPRVTATTASAGVIPAAKALMPRSAFIERLKRACNPAIRYEKWSKTPLPAASLLNAG